MTLEEIRSRYPAHGDPKPIPRHYDDALFETLYPGIYSHEAEAAVRARIGEDEALIARGAVDPAIIRENRIPEDYPGYYGKAEVTPAFARYAMERYDPDNRLYSDEGYAKELGYDGLPIYFTYAMFYLVQTPPREIKDIFTPCNISHSIRCFRPIYVGDTIYGFRDRQYTQDLTPEEGSTVRTLAVTTEASSYNQRGELVATYTYNILEHIRIFKDPSFRQGMDGPFVKAWDSPNWWKRPRHVYTDQDWDFIRTVWKNEAHRGAEPFYWEDVKIGDRPPWTLEGPVDDAGGVFPEEDPNGLGYGGTRTLKREILTPETFRNMVRNPYDGVYRLARWNDSYPVPPLKDPGELRMENDDPASEPGHRYHFINIYGRDIHFRHIHNYFGDRAVIRELRWSIMSPEALEECEMPGRPEHPNYKRYHKLDPEGRPVTAHGLEGDIALTKSYVRRKYIEDGRGCVELIWSVEDIEGNVWQEGSTILELPRRSAVS